MIPIHKKYSKETLKEIIEYTKKYKWFHSYIICNNPKEALEVFYNIPQNEMLFVTNVTMRNDIGYIDLWFENHSSIRIITYSKYLPALCGNAVLECRGIAPNVLDLSHLRPYVEK